MGSDLHPGDEALVSLQKLDHGAAARGLGVIPLIPAVHEEHSLHASVHLLHDGNTGTASDTHPGSHTARAILRALQKYLRWYQATVSEAGYRLFKHSSIMFNHGRIIGRGCAFDNLNAAGCRPVSGGEGQGTARVAQLCSGGVENRSCWTGELPSGRWSVFG